MSKRNSGNRDGNERKGNKRKRQGSREEIPGNEQDTIEYLKAAKQELERKLEQVKFACQNETELLNERINIIVDLLRLKENQNEAHSKELEKIRSENAKIKTDIDALNTSKQKLEMKLKQVDSTAKKEIEVLKKRIETLEDILLSKETQIEAFGKEMDKVKSDNEKMRTDIKELQELEQPMCRIQLGQLCQQIYENIYRYAFPKASEKDLRGVKLDYFEIVLSNLCEMKPDSEKDEARRRFKEANIAVGMEDKHNSVMKNVQKSRNRNAAHVKIKSVKDLPTESVLKKHDIFDAIFTPGIYKELKNLFTKSAELQAK